MKLSDRIEKDIDKFCVEHYASEPRKHLGASLIGHECKAYLWFVFRWADYEQHDGRKYRLFNRGQLEEVRFIEWLRGIGCEVWAENPETNKQFQFTRVDGHYGGSLDGVATLPDRYCFYDPVLLEFKTSGTGATFDNLVKKGVQVEKPMHYAQMCSYGYEMGLKYALYMAIDKNTDQIHAQIINIDKKYGKELQDKAKEIIFSEERPNRISTTAAFYKCKMCSMKDVCHKDKPVKKNCRSCKFAKPANEGQWFCRMYDDLIPEHFIIKGCDQHTSIV